MTRMFKPASQPLAALPPTRDCKCSFRQAERASRSDLYVGRMEKRITFGSVQGFNTPFGIPKAQYVAANSLCLLKQYEDALGQQPYRNCPKIDWSTFPNLDPMVAIVLEWGHSLTDDQWAFLPADQQEFELPFPSGC